MKKNIFSAICMATLMLVTSVAFTSCHKDEFDTNPFAGTVAMAGYAPNPVARGGELYFIGTGLDQVTKVIFKGKLADVEVTSFVKKEADTLRVIVPKTAEPGVLTLIAGEKTLTSRSSLSFTEPVAFAEKEALSGKKFYPGDTLTIKGSYLNLVKNVVFGGDAYSPVFEFGNNTPDEPMDMYAKVIVPAEAVSGKVKLSFYATGSTEENLVPSEDAIDVVAHNIPTPLVIEAGVPGEVYKVAGQYLDLVTTLLTPAGDSLACLINADGTELSFKVPEYITNGMIKAVSASGIERNAFDFKLFFPENVVATPVDGVRGGDTIALTATHLELIQKVIFKDIKGNDLEELVAAGKVIFPAAAVSGAIKVVTMAETRDEADVVFTTLKPVFGAISKAVVEAEDTVVVTGTNLDLIASIEFVGSGSDASYLIPVSKTEMKWYCPKGTKSGAVKVTMANGEVIAEFATLTMATPNGCYVVDANQLISTDAKPMQAGDVIWFNVENIDRLVNVTVDGADVNFIKNGDKLYVATPAQPKSEFTLALVSDNDLQTYTMKLIQSNARTHVVWEGEHAAGGWASGFASLAWGGYDFSYVRAGSELVVDFVVDPAKEYGCQIRFANGSWSALPGTTAFEGADNEGNIAMADGTTQYRFTLTQAMVDALNNEGGLVICGAWFILQRIRIIEYLPVGHSIWSGSHSAGGWAAGFTNLSWGGYDWTTVAAGTKLHVDFTVDPAKEYGCQIHFGNGSWSALPGTKAFEGADNDGNIAMADDATSYEFELTQEMLDALKDEGGLVICGAWFILTNVSLIY